MSNDVETIRLMRSRWIEAINQNDSEGFCEVLTDDVVWIPARTDAIVGRGNVRDWLEAPFARFRYEFSVADARVDLAGDFAVELASFSTRVSERNGGAPPPPHTGRYLLIWRKIDAETWLIERYVELR